MARIITVLTLVLSILLFPPATLALISNNAVPGDATYPIKRFLEDGIFAVASLNPVSRAWFAAARSDRRFKEFSTLVVQGKAVSHTLNELVSQTDSAAKEISKVESDKQKKELLNQLSQSIQKYDQELEEVSQTAPVPTPKPKATLKPLPEPTHKTELEEAQPTPVPTPAITASSDTLEEQQQEIEEARRKLEEIRRAIEEERNRLEMEEQRRAQEEEERRRQENIIRVQFVTPPSPSPSPSPSPQQSPSPSPSSQGSSSQGGRRSFGQPSSSPSYIISPTPTPTPTPTPNLEGGCQSDCARCTPRDTCGAKTYDTCEDNFGRKSSDSTFCTGGATGFRCYAFGTDPARVCNSWAPTYTESDPKSYNYSCSACNISAPSAQCPVNSVCCAVPLQTCSANGLDTSCPAGFQWCYNGYCVNDNFNPQTNNC